MDGGWWCGIFKMYRHTITTATTKTKGYIEPIARCF